MQTAIFEVNENIKALIPTLPVSPIIATRLTDIDDKEIINCTYILLHYTSLVIIRTDIKS